MSALQQHSDRVRELERDLRIADNANAILSQQNGRLRSELRAAESQRDFLIARNRELATENTRLLATLAAMTAGEPY